MKTGVSSRQQHFDNLSYVSDGRDRISYLNDPYGIPSHNTVTDRNGVILQAKELRRPRHDQNIAYKFRPGQDSIYAYSNAAFSDTSGADSRGPSMRSNMGNFYFYRSSLENIKQNRTIYGICSKYWYVFALLTIIILAAIGVIVGVVVFRSKHRYECSLSCDSSEKLVQLNSTHCQCQLINECESDPPVCGPFSCIKLNGTGYECDCTTGFHHPPISQDLTICEDINECENQSACNEHQICNNTNGDYTCSCESGFETIMTADGIICQDLNECSDPNPCSNARCINTDGSFECVCNTGFVPDLANPLHCDDINECLRYTPCTGDNEMCHNTLGSFSCLCAQGYRRNEEGNCTNINECAESSTACDINSRCEDRNGSFACCISTITNECVECGYDYVNPQSTVRNVTRKKRMTDGQPVEPGRFPWIAALLIKKEYYHSEPRYVCSASLVSSWNVITAAHCLDEEHFRKQWELTGVPSSFKDIFEIRIGVHNLSMNSTNLAGSQSYSIANFTFPLRYQSLGSDSAIVQDDIALIKLTKRIERSSNIDWICLPTNIHAQDQDTLKVVSYGNGDEDLVQQQLDIRVLHNYEAQSECHRQLGDIAEDAFCAMSVSQSSTLGRGDSGAGAMLFSTNNRWHLAGTMSKIGLQRTYSAMTNVSNHIEWLKSLIER